MIEPKNGEWWLCERCGVKTVFLRKDDEWRSDERDTYSYYDVVPLFKMIEDKPSDCASVSPKRTQAEYEKVTESIFDLRDEFERGELYFDKDNCTGGIYCSIEQYQKIRDMIDFNQAALNNNIYRKVEKEIDERQEFIERANGLVSKSHAVDYSLGKMYDAGCRFVGANGEID